MTRITVPASLLALSMLLVAPATARDDDPDPAATESAGAVARELRRLNDTLDAVRQLLVRQLETESLDLLLKRADFAAERAAELESQLRRARAQRDSLVDEEKRIEAQAEEIARRLAGGAETDPREMESVAAQMVAELEILEARRRDTEREIVDLEGRLAIRERELREWQEIADDRLGGL